MEYVRLGRTGLKVSRLILGFMTYGDPSGVPGCWTKPPAGRSSGGRLTWE